MCSNSDLRFASAALEESQKSPLAYRIGCVAVVSGKVAARGHNHYRTYSKDGFIKNTCSCHAEIDVLRKCLKQQINKKINLYVMRTSSNGDVACSAPCIDCFMKMKDFNIKNIVYIGHDGELKKKNMDTFVSTHVSSGKRAITEKRVKCI
jgi:tRNA(Arg) A34 adenosine deaminase TadA